MVQKTQSIDIRKIPDFLRPYFEARKKGALAQYYLNQFYSFKDDDSRFNKSKCRDNYILSLSLNLEAAIADGAIKDSDLEEKIKKFRKHDFNYHHRKFTTKQEINMINQILDDVIDYLENKNPS